jgi:thiol:disulfide interchange protein DsbD
LALDLPVGGGSPRPSAAAPAFRAAAARTPRDSAALGMGITAAAAGRDVLLRLTPSPGDGGFGAAVEFFARDGDTVAPAAPQVVARDGAALVMRLQLAANRRAPLDRLRGVVAAVGRSAGGAVTAVDVDVPVMPAPVIPRPTARRFLAALGLAALGGLLLNLMPCVFPVLSIKILDFVRRAGGSAPAARRHGVAYAGGVMVSMWVLAAGLLALRAGGAQLGWGFQLQSPAFVLGIAAFLLLLALSLLGVFEIGIGLTGIAGRVRASGSFVAGVLAVVVATPCTAPFMGTALAYALALPAGAALLVFTALGGGLALPYVILCVFPGWLRWLPRPGPWLETTKQVLAFPLLGAVVWLVWVLAQQTGPDGVGTALAVLLVVGFAAWLLGRAAGLRHPRPRRLLRTAALGLMLIALGAGVASVGQGMPPATAARGPWSPFSADVLARHRAAGRPVFVDFTAAWCVTCQVNERLVLDTADVQARFASAGVVLLRADWTTQDPSISMSLEAHGRSGVPLYVLYGRDPAAAPVVLPSVLTRGIVLDALDRLTLGKETT